MTMNPYAMIVIMPDSLGDDRQQPDNRREADQEGGGYPAGPAGWEILPGLRSWGFNAHAASSSDQPPGSVHLGSRVR
jgi:hypothetical protein